MTRIPDILLERFLLRECSPDEERLVNDALAKDPSLKGRISELARSDSEILAAYPADAEAGLIGERAGTEKRRRSFRAVAVPALGLAAAFLLVLLPLGRVHDAASVRTKGDARLLIYARKGNGEVLLSRGAAAREGDVLQVAYQVPKKKFGVIFSVDGVGALTLHYPSSANGATGLASGRRTALPEAYQLDNAPDYEAFFLVVSDSPLLASKILKTAGRLAGLPAAAVATNAALFAPCETKIVLIRKE